MVVCDHPDMNRRYFVADIDDERPNGGTVHIQIYRGQISTLVTPMNKRGSRRSIPFACAACSRCIELQETSLPDLLDTIGPHRDGLFPSKEMVPVEVPDFTDGWYDVLVNAGGPTTIVGYEQRYVIPLQTLCDIVRKLRARGRD
jgi:hypothetical protein